MSKIKSPAIPKIFFFGLYEVRVIDIYTLFLFIFQANFFVYDFFQFLWVFFSSTPKCKERENKTKLNAYQDKNTQVYSIDQRIRPVEQHFLECPLRLLEVIAVELGQSNL